MSLRGKVILYLISAVLFFSLLYGLIYLVIIRPGYQRQKNLHKEKMIARIHAAIASEQSRINTLATDWSNWDAMAAYVQNPSRAFEKDSLPESSLGGLDMDLLLILNQSAKTVFFSNQRTPKSQPAQFEALEKRQGSTWQTISDSLGDPRLKSWLISTPDGPWVLVSSPIRTSQARPPVLGRVLLGRLITAHFSEHISQTISEKCQIIFFERKNHPQGKPPPYHPENKLQPTNNTSPMEILTTIKDSFGKPAFHVRVIMDSNPFQILEQTVNSAYFILLTITVLFGILVYVSIHHSIIKRIIGIAKKTEKITFFRDLSVRVPDDGTDEMGNLARHINQMLERLEYEVEQSIKMKNILVTSEKLAAIGRLAANIAHEVNNPLFAIANTIQVIKKETSPKESMLEAVSLAEKEIKRVRLIMRDLLDFARLRREDFLQTDLVEIIHAAIQVLTWSRKIDDVTIDWPHSSSIVLHANADGLQQVFMNLIQNAAEASGPGGMITIRFASQDENVLITVTDDGPGFSEATQVNLFEPFNTQKSETGTGLGLYVSHLIIEQHHGDIFLGRDDQLRNQVTVSIPLKGETA